MKNTSRWALAATFLLLAGKAAADPAEVVLHSFQGTNHRDGSQAESDLIADADGNLYGTTQAGGKGSSGAGTVFELSPTANPDVWTETILYVFQDNGQDGTGPLGGLLMDGKGSLYGTTQGGGATNHGTAFKLTPPKTAGGKWKERILYSFCSQANCTDGSYPTAGLTLGKKSVLFGTTQFGGFANEGAAFQLTPSHGSWTENVLYSFCGVLNCADGFEPNEGRLLLSKTGVLYGATGKSDSAGTVYALVPGGGGLYSETVLHDFLLGGGDGRAPYGGVVADKAGNLYGTTTSDSANGCGIVFQLSEAGDQAGYQILYHFCSKEDHSDGAIPYAGVTLKIGTQGLPTAIYGTTINGGSANSGVVFKLTGSTESVVYNFCSQANCADGGEPRFGPLLDLNGSLLGTTLLGGSANLGAVYGVPEQ